MTGRHWCPSSQFIHPIKYTCWVTLHPLLYKILLLYKMNEGSRPTDAITALWTVMYSWPEPPPISWITLAPQLARILVAEVDVNEAVLPQFHRCQLRGINELFMWHIDEWTERFGLRGLLQLLHCNSWRRWWGVVAFSPSLMTSTSRISATNSSLGFRQWRALWYHCHTSIHTQFLCQTKAYVCKSDACNGYVPLFWWGQHCWASSADLWLLAWKMVVECGRRNAAKYMLEPSLTSARALLSFSVVYGFWVTIYLGMSRYFWIL